MTSSLRNIENIIKMTGTVAELKIELTQMTERVKQQDKIIAMLEDERDRNRSLIDGLRDGYYL